LAESNYVEIGWSLWGVLPHLLPQRTWLTSTSARRVDAAPKGQCD
jgi:hypothetical protein